MKFERSVASKYLMPKWRQLSVSIISLISIFVIALVVWLIVVFFSVTQGLEKTWTQKIVALTSPIRVSPTNAYYKSYYYLVDGISVNSNYTLKSIGDKLAASTANPYDPDFDEELPRYWGDPDLDAEGHIKDLVKLAVQKIEGIENVPGIAAKEYELTVANLKIQLSQDNEGPLSDDQEVDASQSHLSQAMYIGVYDADNPSLPTVLLPFAEDDINHFVDVACTAGAINRADLTERFCRIFEAVQIEQLQTPPQGWRLPHELLSEGHRWVVAAVFAGEALKTVHIPQRPSTVEALVERYPSEGITASPGLLEVVQGKIQLTVEGEPPRLIDPHTPLIAEGNLPIAAHVRPQSFQTAQHYRDITFDGSFRLQEIPLSGLIAFGNLRIEKFSRGKHKELDLRPAAPVLPRDNAIGDGVLLPKGYRESGARIGDRGYLSYTAPTASAVQEQRVPIFVAGFYDPGIFSLGSKIVLADPSIVAMIRSAYPNDENPLTNGLNVHLKNLDDAEEAKAAIEQAFQDAGIAKYWRVETYREFEFTKDILQQLRSERNLFTLISAVIIIVACSNIVSMLIILVNDKKMEIGILRSMGATSRSIAMIFGLCGVVMGLLGSLLGTVIALVTLHNLQSLVDLISRLQGFQAFNPLFFGEALPNEVNFEVLTFVMVATGVISLIAGVIPAIKASLLRPAAILRSE